MLVTPSMLGEAREIRNIFNLTQHCRSILNAPTKLPQNSEITVPGLPKPMTPSEIAAACDQMMADAGQHMRSLEALIQHENPRWSPQLQAELAQVLIEKNDNLPPTL